LKPNKPEDIWRFIERGSVTECWPYRGDTFSGRYGRFTLRQRPLLAHRHIYAITKGKIPAGLYVMHKCNNKLCCNPNHLTIGTGSQNQRHASASGAFAIGQSGIRGIVRDKKRGYWVAEAYLNGKRRNLYTGPHKAKAILARQLWDAKHGISFPEMERRT
jgi:hypothetical protein